MKKIALAVFGIFVAVCFTACEPKKSGEANATNESDSQVQSTQTSATGTLAKIKEAWCV